MSLGDNENKLLQAVFNSNPAKLRDLVEEGFEIDEYIGKFKLLHAAAQTGNVEVLKLLIDAGGAAFINVFDEIPSLPLTYAAAGNHHEAVQYLIDIGADINANDPDQGANTPLRDVTYEADFETLGLLLKNGADPKIKGWMQLTALDKAIERFEKNKTPENQRILDLVKTYS